MTTNRTELVFILDKSGSMAGLEADTIGGYNAMLGKQKPVKQAKRLSPLFCSAMVSINCTTVYP